MVTGSLYVVGEARTALFSPATSNDEDPDPDGPDQDDPDDDDPDEDGPDDWTGFSEIPEIDGHVPR